MGSLLLTIAIDIGGLVLVYFILKARISRALEIDGLLADARKEARLLSIEINETTDRNITLIEDRLTALRELLAEADRRMGVLRRETGRRQAETEVYTKLGRRAPVRPPIPSDDAVPEDRDSVNPQPAADVFGMTDAGAGAMEAPIAKAPEAPVRLDLGSHPAEPVPLSLVGRLPEVVTAAASVIPPKSLRERAIELHRSGFSADIIAARLGATISEIELLVSLEERRGVAEGTAGP